MRSNLENLDKKFRMKSKNLVDATNGDLAVIDAMENVKKRQV